MVSIVPDIATVDATYTLGLCHIFSGSAEHTGRIEKKFGRFRYGSETTKRIKSVIINCCKIKNTISDRHIAEFNQLLADYRAEILPVFVSDWDEAAETKKEKLTQMEQFFLWITFPRRIGRLC